MVKETLQAPSGQGHKFRPFASAIHHVTKGRYITSNDPRGYIPVYEYPLNSQWIMMDIDDGYILWTGIWKALGNSKADIVKMIDSQPELASVIRRVRGGYLKIQGTWMPFEIALRLARRVAWNIREDLIPLFGPTFPDTCLSPDQPGYGQVVPSTTGRRRARRNAQPAVVPVHGGYDWHLAMPHSTHPMALQQPSLFAPLPPGNQYSSSPIHSVELQRPGHYSPTSQSSSGDRADPAHRDRRRFSPYSSVAMPPPRNPATSSSSRDSLTLDIPALSLSRNTGTLSPINTDLIALPEIQPPTQTDSRSVYSLPPISALEDLRGVDTHDSAAVLRRLQSPDDFESSQIMGDQKWRERRSLSAPAPKIPSRTGLFPISTQHLHRRSLGDTRSPHQQLRVSLPSDVSRDGYSTCDPSPISPVTPRSAVLGKDQLALVPLSVLKEQRRTSQLSSFPVVLGHNTWLADARGETGNEVTRIPPSRYPYINECQNVPLSAW